jgi:hypothetical protein
LKFRSKTKAPGANSPSGSGSKKLREVRRHEGRDLSRSNLSAENPEKLWQFYIQFTQEEAAFKDLKNDLACGRSSTNWNAGSKRAFSSLFRPTAVAKPRAKRKPKGFKIT